MTFLGGSKDAPREFADGKRQTLARPNPGINEHRIYYDHHSEDFVNGEEVSQVPVAEFVSCLCADEPTDQEWRELLAANGYLEDQITAILAE